MIHFPIYSLDIIFIYKYIRMYNNDVKIVTGSVVYATMQVIGHWGHGGTAVHNRIDDVLYLLRLLTAAKIIRKSLFLSTVMMCHKC